MEIKYDKSGQPLPEHEQDWAKQPQHASTAPAPTKEFKINESPDTDGEPHPIQSENPFVAEYRRKQQGLSEPAVAAPEPEVAQEPEASADVEPVEEQPAKQDHPNFKSLRLAAERAQRERDEALSLLRERNLRDESQRQFKQTKPEPEIDDLDITDDGFVEPKHIKQVYQEAKRARKELAEYKQKSSKEMQEMMLYRQYPDISQVVSEENIAILNEIKPAYARQLKAMHDSGDIYGTGELAYNYMVDLGIHKPKASPVVKDFTSDKMRAATNAAKPRPLASAGTAKSDSPMAKAHALAGELSDADMRRHYQEMEQAIRNRGD